MIILKELRHANKLTQENLASLLLINSGTIAQYEANKYPSYKILYKLSNIFKVSIDYLIQSNNCNYSRSLDFLNQAILLDNKNNPKLIKDIMITINGSIANKDKVNVVIKQDNIQEKLNNNFHSNLKSLRTLNNITQKEIAEKLNIVRSVVGMYEIKSYPSIDKIIKLSEIFNCSIHALITGEKLSFDFKNKKFGTTILLADHLLSIDDKNFLIKLMNNLIKNE